jgi:peptidoglycan/LPS O-acetylase OafA/YrhL
MVVTTRSCDGSWAYAIRFLIRRFARIWPVYVVATALFILLPHRLASLQTPGAIWHLILGVFFIPATPGDIGPPMLAFPALPVGWTLNYEMYFYAFFGLSLLFGRVRWVAFAAWLALTLVGLPLAVAPGNSLSLNPSTSYGLHGYAGLIVNPIILLFAAGCVVGLIYPSRFSFRSAWVNLGAMAVTLAAVVLQYAKAVRIEHGVLQWGLTLVPLLLVFTIASKRFPPPLPRPAIYLGEISFSLYLVHPFVQEGLDVLAVRAGWAAPSGFVPFMVSTAACVGVAALSHRWLELSLAGMVRDVLLRATRLQRPVPVAANLAA